MKGENAGLTPPSDKELMENTLARLRLMGGLLPPSGIIRSIPDVLVRVHVDAGQFVYKVYNTTGSRVIGNIINGKITYT